MTPEDFAKLEQAEQRTDYRLILNRIEPGSRVLDLGCGSGWLLALLREKKNVVGYGVELSSNQIIECIGKGLSVFHGDIDEGLRDFEDQSFDYVIVNQTLPVTRRPSLVLEEVLRVGRCGIISFANFAYWRIRLHLLLTGRMPVTESIPYEWYDTPNIHLFTIRDFRSLCRKMNAEILDSCFFTELENGRARCNLPLPNMQAAYALFAIKRPESK